jgi:excisionase family DNA binding protein
VTGELLVTLDEAARRLSLCRRSVQELVYGGTLAAVKVGRSRRIAVIDLESFVEGLRVGTAAADDIAAAVDYRRSSTSAPASTA